MLAVATESRASRVGLDPIEHVFLMENHDQAYRIWRDAGVKEKILVHIDAHHDMWWIDDPNSITIANFIAPALKNDIVRHVFWVVPDATWQTAKGRRAVGKHLRSLVNDYPSGTRVIRAAKGNVSTVVLGKALNVCSLDSLPRVDEEVLLDIDVDFLLIPRVSYAKTDVHSSIPWCWPEELLTRIRKRGIRAELTTIAYSVEGGYTPLKWKFLGDELALRFMEPHRSEATLPMQLVREAAQAAHLGDTVTAEQRYRRACEASRRLAAPSYHLAHLYAKAGRINEGRVLYQRSLAADSSYRTAYNCEAFNHYHSRRFGEAEAEFKRVLALDPNNAAAHLGLAKLAARKRRWIEAEALLRKAVALDPHLIDGYRVLADVLAKQGVNVEAIDNYEHSLKLAMHGYSPLHSGIATQMEGSRILDTFHWKIHAKLARLYQRQGAMSRAIAGYRMCIGGGYGGAILPLRLAGLYCLRREWRNAVSQIWVAARAAWQQLFGRQSAALVRSRSLR